MSLISVAGKKGSGKDLVGRMIQYHFSSDRDKYTFPAWDEKVTKHKSPQNSAYTVFKFADALKDIVCLLLGCTRADLEDMAFKERYLGEEWDRFYVFENRVDNRLSPLFATAQEAGEWLAANRAAGSFGIYRIMMNPRILLQLMGTECGRQIIHPNIWVNSTMMKYDTPLDNHMDKFDAVFINDGSIMDLFDKVTDYLSKNISR
jgi:hypothetical protein